MLFIQFSDFRVQQYGKISKVIRFYQTKIACIIPIKINNNIIFLFDSNNFDSLTTMVFG